jgi:DNA helicase-2/ATP-dependent DNA helicase PcrA
MKIYLGPPGTGKTTRLLQVVEQELSNGVRPDQIAFVAFTRKAAYEARQRAREKFGFTDDDLPYFKTLHSFAFKMLALDKSRVMDNQDYQEIGTAIGMTFGMIYEEDTDLPTGAGDKKGNNCAYLEQIARLTGKGLAETCTKYAMERYYDVKLYSDALHNYKKSRNKVDFTDMMEMFIEEGDCPSLKVVIVDEAQDLTPLQWRAADKILAVAERVYIAGDDDQAIYEWAGADVQRFLSLRGDFETLPTSYRLPRCIHKKACRVLTSIHRRYEKVWAPKDEEGRIFYYNDSDQVDYSLGTWLLLCRNRYTLNNLCATMKRLGYPYVMFGKSSVDNDNVKALVAWETLRKGEAVNFDQARLLCRKLREGAIPKTAAKSYFNAAESDHILMKDFIAAGLVVPPSEDWMTALHMPDSSREYYRSIRRKGESLLAAPRIIVSTIHQAKGGEADHVLITPDMSEACYQGMKNNSDVEGRVFYVAVTRAKHTLHIMQPRTNKYYELRGKD